MIVHATITGDRHRRPLNRPMVDGHTTLLRALGVTHLDHGAFGYTDWSMSAIAEYAIAGLVVTPYPVNHALDGPWPAAGPRRNGRMLRSSAAETLIWFPGNRGTADCWSQARDLGLLTWSWSDADAAWILDPAIEG